jgi:hypothetical protein
MTMTRLLPHQRLTVDGAPYGITREQATLAMDAINVARKLMVAEANRLTRKRSMSSNDIQQHSQLSTALANLEPLREAVGTEHHIFGY